MKYRICFLLFIILKYTNSYTQTAEEYYEIGNKYLDEGNNKVAIENYSKSIILSSSEKNVFFNRGVARGNIKEYKEASLDFIEVVKLDSTDFVAYAYLGYTQYKLGDYIRCIENCNRAIKLNPSYGLSYSYKGVALLRSSYDAQRALKLCDSSLMYKNTWRENIWCHYNRGIVKEYIKDFNGAISDFTESIKYDTSFFHPGYLARIDCQKELGNYQEAINDYSKIIEHFPNVYLGYMERGIVEIEIKDKDRACEDLKKAEQLGAEEDIEKLKKLIKRNCKNK